MKRTLTLRREVLTELPTDELVSVRGASTPYVTNGHHCHGSTLCGAVPDVDPPPLYSVPTCPPPPFTYYCTRACG